MAQGPARTDNGHGHGHEHEHGGAGGDPHDHHGFLATAIAIGRGERARRLRIGFALAVLTLAALTLGVELALRLTHQRARAMANNVTLTNRRWLALGAAKVFEEIDDPVRRYAMRPGARAEVDGFHFRISAARTRGPEVPAEKPAGERRLLCLGDSFAFGLWCDEEETVVARIAAMATAREEELGTGLVWRPLDLGVPGYHLGQALRAFEQEGLGLAPDLVLVYANTNDIEQTGFYYDADLGTLRRDFLPLPVFLKRALWHGSHLYGWISTRHARAVERGRTPYLEPRVPWAHVRADNQAYTRAALAGIAELCRERALPLFVIDQPLMDFLGSTRRADWPVLPLEAWFRDQCRELGLPALHLLGWLRGYADGIDRFAEGIPPDCLTDQYIADERLQEALTWARARARESGRVWDELPFDEQLPYFAGFPTVIPENPDFHLTGAGYAHIARLAYSRLCAEGLLP